MRVDYEPLPGVYDPLDGDEARAPHVHEGGNLLRAWHLRKGDIAVGFAQAEVVVEQTYRTPFVDHLYLETETGIGWIDAEGVLVLRVSTQVLEHFRDVADVLRLPHGRVRLEGAYLGGGFGGKEDVTVECLLGLLVWKTRRPVPARLLPRGELHRPRQAASVRVAVPDGRDEDAASWWPWRRS